MNNMHRLQRMKEPRAQDLEGRERQPYQNTSDWTGEKQRNFESEFQRRMRWREERESLDDKKLFFVLAIQLDS